MKKDAEREIDRLCEVNAKLLEALEREQSFRVEVVEGIMQGRLNAGRMRAVALCTRAAIAETKGEPA